jgi:putative nucleotidyltransferase with HDIG domain
MSGDSTDRGKASAGPAKKKRPTRQLNLPSRVRGSFRREVDRLLGLDALWSALFVLTVVLALGGPWFGLGYEDLVAGQVAPHDIEARESFDHLDMDETERRRLEARESVPDVYVYDADRGNYVTVQLSSVFQHGRAALEAASLLKEDAEAAVAVALRDRFDERAVQVLIQQGFDAALERELTLAVKDVMSVKVVTNKASLEREGAITLTLRGGKQKVERFDGFVELGQARTRVREGLAERLELSRDDERALGELAESFVDINVYLDREATQRAKQDAALAVPLVFTRIERGEQLVAEGQRLTEEDLTKIEAAKAAAGRPSGPRVWIGLVLVAAMLAFFLFRYTRYHQRAFRKLEHLHALLVLVLISMLLLAEGIMWLARRLSDNLDAPFNQIGAYPYLIPLGAGAILVALLANGRIATVYSAFCALLFGAAQGWDAHLAMWGMIVQCAGVYAISTYRDRAALLRAGLVVGSAGAVSALALESLRGLDEPLAQSLYATVLAFIGGAVGVGLLVSFTLPLLETLFNVLTDIRLLELSNVNNPLLSELAVRAPGSYNHSLVVGTLAEEAAKAIGANSLFCRVAAFYHDIGKMNKPEYFVENQRGVNPHDRLSPSMSALIIASHVKDGIKMAREGGLPEQIIDIIPQHHGTKLMTYFYEKAKQQADPSLGAVKEEDFRYPGPKPQTREAAIFMLADAVEAAARTVDDPTANRLKEMIRKVTNAIVVTGELDACDLTFADLNRIQAAFLRCLVSMYHHRVDYPGFDFRRPKGEGKPGQSPPADIRERRMARGS